jgi:hypothetical protein
MTSYLPGLAMGLLIGYLVWKLPAQTRARHVRRLREQLVDVKRIKAQFRPTSHIPNHSPRPWRREQLISRLVIWWVFLTIPAMEEVSRHQRVLGAR